MVILAYKTFRILSPPPPPLYSLPSSFPWFYIKTLTGGRSEDRPHRDHLGPKGWRTARLRKGIDVNLINLFRVRSCAKVGDLVVNNTDVFSCRVAHNLVRKKGKNVDIDNTG